MYYSHTKLSKYNYSFEKKNFKIIIALVFDYTSR